jgi:flagellar biosynthesis protein FlhB
MDQQRTEEATPRKLRKARERGEVAKSPLATTALVLLGVSAAVVLGAEAMLEAWRGLAISLLSGGVPPAEALARSADVTARALAGPLAAAVVCGALGTLLQIGPLFAPRAIAPDLARLDPTRGLARMNSPAELAPRLSALALTALFFVVAADLIVESLPGLAGRTEGGAGFVLGAGSLLIEALLRRAIPLIALAGAMALVYRRWRFRQAQRMTRRERRDEQRETEGEPEARRRRADLHRELSVNDASQESLTDAALVVRGIGRAVVLRWRRTSDAPPAVGRIARGAMVARLVARAGEEGVPVVHDEHLAGELERLSAGRTLARASLMRLARHLSKHPDR